MFCIFSKPDVEVAHRSPTVPFSGLMLRFVQRSPCCGPSLLRLLSSCSTEKLYVGFHVSETRIFTLEDVRQFAVLGRDSNPIHIDKDFAATTVFKKPIVHGLFVASMFGGILGSQFPGSIYMLQNLLFKAPCFVGSSVTARLEVSSINFDRRVVIWRSTITSSEGVLLIDGEARMKAPQTLQLASQ